MLLCYHTFKWTSQLTDVKGRDKMKNFITIIIVFGVLLVTIPALALINRKVDAKPSTDSAGDTGVENVKILRTSDNKVTEISLREYMIGSVLAQMPAGFEPEALKAQAVIAHTYIERRKMSENKAPTPDLLGADVSDSNSKFNAYFTKDQAKSLYGDSFDENYKKIEEAVDAVIEKVIIYDKEPIIVAFHSMSGHKTESSLVSWGAGYPYLASVERKESDTLKGYKETKTFTYDEFSARLSQEISDLTFSEEKDKWVEKFEKSDAGTVLKVFVCGKEIPGSQLRDILSLRSCCYDIENKDGNIVITTYGVGHDVGLSQYGADALAKEGKSYEEILKYYFTGVTIEDR